MQSQAVAPMKSAQVGCLVVVAGLAFLGWKLFSAIQSDAEDPTEGLQRPPAELAYIATLRAAQTRYDAAPNDLQRAEISTQLRHDAPATVPMHALLNWTGVINTLGASPEGKAYTMIAIGKGIIVTTAIDDATDRSYGTLIPQGSPIFRYLSQSKVGDRVAFSAEMLAVSGNGHLAYFKYPEMIVRFVSIGPAS